MPGKSSFVLVCFGLALTIPSVAVAQVVGDHQYDDPFANVTPPRKGGQEGAGGAPEAPPSANQDSSGVEVPQQSQGAVTPTTTTLLGQQQTENGAPAATPSLPRTGLAVGLVAALGAAMLGAGLALRRLA